MYILHYRQSDHQCIKLHSLPASIILLRVSTEFRINQRENFQELSSKKTDTILYFNKNSSCEILKHDILSIEYLVSNVIKEIKLRTTSSIWHI